MDHESAGIVAMIIMTLVTFVITGAGHRIVISSVHDAGLLSMNIRTASFQCDALQIGSSQIISTYINVRVSLFLYEQRDNTIDIIIFNLLNKYRE